MVVANKAELVAQQLLNGNLNKKTWGNIIYNANLYIDLTAAVTDAAVIGGQLLLPPGTYRVSSDLTIPENVTLWFMNGAKLSIDAGVTVTINGPVDAGLHQIFSGAGTVSGDLKVPHVYPQWWGAVADGVTDIAPALQSAINTNKKVVLPQLLSGSYALSSVTIPGDVSIEGEGRFRTPIKALGSTTKMFIIQGWSVRIENIFIDMNSAPNTSVVFYFNTAVSGLGDIRVKNIRIENAYTVITDANDPTRLIANVYFEDVNCYCGKGTAVTLNDFLGFIYLTKFIVDYTASNLRHGINIAVPGIIVNNIEGIILQDADVIGGTSSAGGDGFVFNSCKAIWLNRTMADTVGGTGYKFTNCQYVYTNDVVASLCKRGGIYMKGCTTVEGGRVFVNGATGQAGAVASQDGFYVESINDMNVATITVQNNTGSGFVFNGCQRTIIGSLKSLSNGGSGVKEQNAAGTTAFNIFGNVSSIFNTTNSLVLVAASTVVSNLIPNSGTPQFHVVGPITV